MNIFSVSSKQLCRALLVGFLVSVTSQAFAVPDSIQLELTELVKVLKARIDKDGRGPVAIGGFGEPPGVFGSSSPILQLQLAEALKAAGLEIVAEDFKFQITGSYQGAVDKQAGTLGVRVLAILSDESGFPLQVFPCEIFGEEAVPALMGISVKLNPNDSPFAKHQKMLDAFKHPNVHLSGTEIQTSANSPYAIEVHVQKINGTDYETRQAAPDSERKGLPFVPISKGELIAVRLINKSPHAAAVNLSIDGVNCFAFSEDAKDSRYWILEPNSSTLIRGWHKNDKQSVEFKVVDFPDTAAAKLNLKPSSTIGTISAAFSAAWNDNTVTSKDKPKDEADSRGAGFGKVFGFDTKSVNPFIGHVRDVVVVRYER